MFILFLPLACSFFGWEDLPSALPVDDGVSEPSCPSSVVLEGYTLDADGEYTTVPVVDDAELLVFTTTAPAYFVKLNRTTTLPMTRGCDVDFTVDSLFVSAPPVHAQSSRLDAAGCPEPVEDSMELLLPRGTPAEDLAGTHTIDLSMTCDGEVTMSASYSVELEPYEPDDGIPDTGWEGE